MAGYHVSILSKDSCDFELFKSEICQSIKKMDPETAIDEIIASGEIDNLYNNGKYAKALYLVALVNYLSNKYNLNKEITRFDGVKLKNMKYPKWANMLAILKNDDGCKKALIKGAEPEFLKFNICEGEIENVA